MMIDRQLRFSNDQAVTASAASTDLIDLHSATVNLGTGQPIYWITVCTLAMTDSGSDSTVTAALETDDASSFGSATAVQSATAFGATSAAGTRRVVRLDKFSTAERYLRVYYTVANGNLSQGSFTSFLSTSPDDWTAKANGYDV